MGNKNRPTKKMTGEDKEDLIEYESLAQKSSKTDIINRIEKTFKPNQKQIDFIKTIDKSTITICHGSAGTGKSITALYKGISDALNGNKRLVLIRPIFESASQSLGFLPGELEDKIAPHFKAFQYVLDELIGQSNANDLIKSGKIRFELLNYLRGATLNNSIIICDEAQNMTVDEMILATTRLGRSSKIIFTGDFYQSDLRKAKGSIMEFADMIKEIDGVNKFTFTNKDVVRNPILVEVTKAWEEYKQKKNI